MKEKMDDTNPFSSLLRQGSREEATVSQSQPSTSAPINTILEDIFGFTLDENHAITKRLFYLDEIANSFKRTDLDLQILEHALFERLFLMNDENKPNPDNLHSQEPRVIVYLFNCYKNLVLSNGLKPNEFEKVKSLLVHNVTTAFVQSDIYEQQSLDLQLISVLTEPSEHYAEFFKSLNQGILDDPDGGEAHLRTTWNKFLLTLTSKMAACSLTSFNLDYFNILRIFASDDLLAEILIDCKRGKFVAGADYINSPLGVLLSRSILPWKSSLPYEYFQDVNDRASAESTEGALWGFTKALGEEIFLLIKSLLTRSPRTKNKILQWIGQCLRANADRGKLWNSQLPYELNSSNYTTVSDGFMINLNRVLLKLCQPFCSNYKDNKILKVDPTYTKIPNESHFEMDIHLPDLSAETCLVPNESNEPPLIAQKYAFTTECFFLAHKSIDLGYRVIVDKIVRLNQEIGRLERAHLDIMVQASGGNNDLADAHKRRMSMLLKQYLSMKAVLSEPDFLNYMSEMCSASCHWLGQIAVHPDGAEKSETFAPLNEIPVSFPLPEEIPNSLKYIPEFLIENIVCHLVFLRRFTPKTFETLGFEKLSPILTMILVYMGSPERMRNPHLRARLAEALEGLLPHYKDEAETLNSMGGYQREMLFTKHEHRAEIVTSLLKVFVSIEMTGQSVEFEQKFNYRRPMYAVMNYLWTKEEYRIFFKMLAEEAEVSMDAVTPPLFLRFVNLLMNDAVYLLDEALSNMAKLREMETARENGEWDSLPANERAQNLSYMRHIGVMARFDNILGRDTIKMMQKLTTEITIVFTHATMVDRVAGMLNYFLYNLVGPKKKNFKVKDQQEYSFEPANTVLAICQIYINLSQCDAFCLAVSQDGRSYSPQLFQLAENVLIRIGGGALVEEVREFAAKVALMAQRHQIQEEALADAPEHFLDPIMSTLMTDPVILPSSKQTVDRTTIARHLLSDQTDPFNRMPLSMDQVVPNVKLAEEIRKWFEDRKTDK